MKAVLNKLNNWKLAIIASVGLIYTIIIFINHHTPRPQEINNTPPITTFNNTASGIGVVEPQSEIIRIGTDIAGIVETVLVEVGQKVKLGQPLFTLDQRDIDSKIKTLEASLIVSNLQAADAKAQYDIVAALSDKRVIPKEDFKHRLYAAALAAARINETKAQLEHAIVFKERLTIKAPIAGEILSVNIHPGEATMGISHNQPLICMGDTSKFHLRVEIDEELISSVNSHSRATAIKRGKSNQTFPLNFIRYEPYIRPKQSLAVAEQRVDSRVINVIYAFNAYTAKIFVGEQMDVFIEADNEKGH